MEKVQVVLEFPKELNEVGDALVALVAEVKKASLDGLQLADAVAIVSAVSGKFMAAVDGWQKLAPEYKEDKALSAKCLAVKLAEVSALLL